MAHTRKDTLTPPKEWARHLRPFEKRRIAKAERRAYRDQLRQTVSDVGIDK